MFVIFSFLIGMGAVFFVCTDSDLALRVATLNVSCASHLALHVKFNRLKVKLVSVDPMNA